VYILIISRGYPTSKYKMNGIFEFDQAKALANKGHKVVFCALDLRSLRKKRKWGYESFEKDKVHIESLNFPGGGLPVGFLDKIRSRLLLNLLNKSIKKHGEPDVIHAHFTGSGYALVKVNEIRRLRQPLVLTEHFSGINKENINPRLFKVAQETYLKIDKLISVSSYLSAEIYRKFEVTSDIVPNVIDVELNPDETGNMKRKEGTFTFVSVGRLVPDKQMDLLIKAFALLHQKIKGIELIIYGDGPDKDKLAKIIEKERLEDKVFLMGLVERKAIFSKMLESDCFILASKLETFGVAYAEAMAMGLPVITPRNGGTEDFIHERNSVIIQELTVTGIMNAMKKIYKEIDIYNKKDIREDIINKYSAASVVYELEKIYIEVINSKGYSE